MNNQTRLLDLARAAATHAHCPYSHFAVGAAVLSSSGRFYSGCNVENVSFPEGVCAETSAISAMIAGGDARISEILIFADSSKLITPCGGCRQRIKEFADDKTLIHLADSSGICRSFSLNELLPFSFE